MSEPSVRRRRHLLLSDFFEEQASIDLAQLDFFTEYYTTCHHRHGNHSEPARDFTQFLEIIEQVVDEESSQPSVKKDNDDDTSLMEIGSDGWHVLDHYFCPVFRESKNVEFQSVEEWFGFSGVKLMCPECREYFQTCEESPLLELLELRRNFLNQDPLHELSMVTPLSLCEKYQDVFNQRPDLKLSRYAISDDACADIFGSSLVKCKFSHLCIDESIFHPGVLNGLEKNTSIESLNLSEIVVTEQTCDSLCRVISHKPNLSKLVLSSVLFVNDSVMSRFVQAIHDSKTLKNFEIYFRDMQLSSHLQFLDCGRETMCFYIF